MNGIVQLVTFGTFCYSHLSGDLEIQQTVTVSAFSFCYWVVSRSAEVPVCVSWPTWRTSGSSQVDTLTKKSTGNSYVQVSCINIVSFLSDKCTGMKLLSYLANACLSGVRNSQTAFLKICAILSPTKDDISDPTSPHPYDHFVQSPFLFYPFWWVYSNISLCSFF